MKPNVMEKTGVKASIHWLSDPPRDWLRSGAMSELLEVHKVVAKVQVL